jgi:signal transduction histidine kinase
MRILDRLLNVPSADPDDARRRKLLNILLLWMVVFLLVGLAVMLVLAAIGVGSPPLLTNRMLCISALALLAGAAAIFLINRYHRWYWSRTLASWLFLVLLTVSIFAYGVGGVALGLSPIAFAIPVVTASVLLHPYASFPVALLASVLVVAVRIGRLGTGIDVAAPLTYFLLALVSSVMARSLEHALADLLLINQELDQRVADRTQDLERQSIQLQTASEVARDATATLDVDQLLGEAVRLISSRFGFYHAAVYLIDERGEYALLRAASSEGGKSVLERGHSVTVGKTGIVGHVAGAGEPYFALDVSKDELYSATPELPATRSEMALPLIGHGKVIGVLDVQSIQEASFAEEDVAALSTVADQLANAIENARLFSAELRRRREAETLDRATQALATTLDLHQVLESILSELQRVVPYDSASVQLLRDERLEIIGGHGFPNPGELSGVSFDVAATDNPNSEVVRRRAPLIVEDVPAMYPEFRKEPQAATGSRAWLGVPLLFGDQLIGILALDKREPGSYSREHASLVSAFAAQAAIAIENARLFEEAQRHVTELTALHNIDLAITSTLNLDEVLQAIYEQVSDTLDVTTFYIALYNEKSDDIHARLVVNQGERMPPFTAKLGEGSGLAGWVVRNRQPVWVGDLEKERDALPVEPIRIGTPARSLMACPLVVRDKVVGVISAQCSEPDAFDEGHRRLFAGIASQVAVAVENARLFEETSRRLKEARLIQEVVLAGASTLNFNLVLERSVKALNRTLGIDRLGFLLPDEEDCMLVSHPSLVGFAEGAFRIPIEDSLAGRAYRTGRPARVQNMMRTPVYPGQEPETGSALSVPVRVGDRIVAVLHVEVPQAGAFGEDELRLFTTIAGQLGVTLENARLYQRLEAQAAELSRAYEELQEFDRLRTQLVQNVGHELRTPLGLIKGYVELLLEGEMGDVPDNQLAALQIMRDRTTTLARLIHNLTMLQAIPREALVLASVSVIDVVRNVLDEHRRSAEEAGITFSEDLPAELPRVVGDQERLELVFSHLVDNAIKFSPAGGTVTIRASANQQRISVSVIDQGIGIPAEHLGRIFERFYQVDGSASRRFGGMGIGLALVWEIVEAHGGTVEVESEPGKGSSFTITLPQAGAFFSAQC